MLCHALLPEGHIAVNDRHVDLKVTCQSPEVKAYTALEDLANGLFCPTPIWKEFAAVDRNLHRKGSIGLLPLWQKKIKIFWVPLVSRWAMLLNKAQSHELMLNETLMLFQITDVFCRWKKGFKQDKMLQKSLKTLWLRYLAGGSQSPMAILSYDAISSALCYAKVDWMQHVKQLHTLFNQEDKTEFQQACLQLQQRLVSHDSEPMFSAGASIERGQSQPSTERHTDPGFFDRSSLHSAPIKRKKAACFTPQIVQAATAVSATNFSMPRSQKTLRKEQIVASSLLPFSAILTCCNRSLGNLTRLFQHKMITEVFGETVVYNV